MTVPALGCPQRGAPAHSTHLLDPHSIDNDLLHPLLGRLVQQVLEHEAGKVAVQTLEGKARDHQGGT